MPELTAWLFAAALLGLTPAASAQDFARHCPPLAVGTAERAVQLETGPLNVVRGAVIALRVALQDTGLQPDQLHVVRIGPGVFGGALLHPSMGFSPSESEPALRFVVDDALFPQLLAAAAVELVATDGTRLTVPLLPSALVEARACIDRHNLPLLDASDARSRDRLSLLRLDPEQRPSVRSMASRPVYPEKATREGREGRTLTQVTIDARGRASACTIARSSGSSDLDEAACASIARWIFHPATDAQGLPVETRVNLPMVWQLEQERD